MKDPAGVALLLAGLVFGSLAWLWRPPLVAMGTPPDPLSARAHAAALLADLNRVDHDPRLGQAGKAALDGMIREGADPLALLRDEATRGPTGPVTMYKRGLRLHEALAMVGTPEARSLLLDIALHPGRLPPAGAKDAALRWLDGAAGVEPVALLQADQADLRVLALSSIEGQPLNGVELNAVERALSADEYREAVMAARVLGATPSAATVDRRIDALMGALVDAAHRSDMPEPGSYLSPQDQVLLATVLALGSVKGGEARLAREAQGNGGQASAAKVALGLLGYATADIPYIASLAESGPDLWLRLAAVEALHTLDTPEARRVLDVLAQVDPHKVASEHPLLSDVWFPVREAAARRDR